MRVKVLGPLRVLTAAGEQEPAGALQRQLLGLLVAAGARPLSAELLMEALWGPEPNEHRTSRLQLHVHRLRKLLGESERISHGPLGYTLELAADDVDARTFEVMLERALASSDVQGAIRMLEEALALWRGPAYEAISDPLVETEARRLTDRRLDAVETLASRYLAAGSPEAAAELVDAPARDHPWREGLAVVRMAALSRLGRQRDALEVYQDVRNALVEELGIEPGPQLQEAQAAVLAGEQVAVEGPSTTPTVPIPSQLPLPPSVFAGRDREVAQLDEALVERDGRVGARVVVISGTAGVGKSALALTWARAHEHEFPDGVVHLDLRGWSSDRPVSVETALGRLLRSFGVTTATGEVGEQAAQLRSVVRDRKVLFLLDNAGSVEQVRPLLPSAPGCVALVTSRDQLAGLVAHEGAIRLDMSAMGDEEAVGLLAQLLGPEMGADRDGLVELARRCAHLPLAMCVAAEYVRSRPLLGLDGVLQELADASTRLDVLDDGAGAGVRALFRRSYDQLDDAAATAFRMLGRLPSPHLDLPALGAMMDAPPRVVRGAVAALVRAHLVFEHQGRPGFPRYGTHDLLAAFAGELAEEIDGEAGQAAVDRLFDHYATGAVRAAAMLDPAVSGAAPGSDSNRVELAASGGVAGPDLPDPETASTWLATELTSLVEAAAAASDAVDERLCASAGVLHAHLYGAGTGGRRLGRALQQLAIEAAERRGDVRELSERYNSVAVYEAELWQLDRSREHMAAAVDVLGEDADDFVRGRALHNQAVLLNGEARHREAVAMCRQALSYHQGAAALDAESSLSQDGAPGGSRRAEIAGGIARALNTLGSAQLGLGMLEEAEVVLAEAADVAKAFEEPIIVAVVAYNRGELALRAGRVDEARGRADEMIAAVESDGLGAFQGQAWNLLGTVHTAGGQPQRAVPLHRRALQSARTSGDQYLEVEAMVRLAEALAAIGDRNAALTTFRQAASLADNPAAVEDHVRALRGLASTYVGLGLPAAARDSLERAIELCQPNDLDDAPLREALAELP